MGRSSLAQGTHNWGRPIAIALAIAGSVVVGRLIGQGRLNVMVLVVAIPFGVLLSRSAYAAITVSIATAVILPSTINWLQLPTAFAYTSHISVLLVTLVTLFEGVRKRRILVKGWVVGWLFCVCCAAVIASTSTAALQSIVGYSIGPLLMLAIMNSQLTDLEESGLLKTLAFLVAIQIPVIAIQKIVYFNGNPDRVGGTLGRAGTQFLGVFMAAAWCMLVAAIVVNHRRRLILVLVVPLMAMAAGEVKAGFVLAAIGTTTMLAVQLLSRPKDADSGVLAGLAIAPVGFILLVYEFAPWLVATYSGVGRSGTSIFTNLDAAKAYLSAYGTGGQAPRIEGLRMIFTDVMDYGVGLGHGPGAMSSSSLVGDVSRSYEVTVLYGWSTSAMRYLFETGPVGLLVFLLALGMLVRLAVGLVRKAETRQVRSLALGFTGTVAVFVVGGFYTAAWEFVGTAVPFWCLAGLIARYSSRVPRNAHDRGSSSRVEAPC